MSDIPAARLILADVMADLVALGHSVQAARIAEVIPMLRRRAYARPPAPVRSALVDATLAAEIRHMARRYPSMSQQAIAVAFDINAGRVSEALQGDR